MRPETPVAVPSHGTHRATDAEFDTWRALQKATDKKRADLLADIVGHPTGMPSVEELDYMNPPLSDDAIRRHLNTLTEVGVVREREFEPGERLRDYPYKFYEITDAARDLFDRNGLFPEEAWQRQYRAVEKTARIREIESMPRPDA
ncbi:ArsR family transcriptional regulator [Haloterrigena alkaliphila]|uniref:ArsR family transcriptional regulator n=1 Tax=Haloterrigena alkaliphila TaxID=2816475 RepID=A0A8A2VG46_9EURY|nr:ArsR family transcriptional regulator [Haloterrigena alkaliphila]QSX00492.1 ArsR family transcriptional regulator [Haloterrigena alkaliphila]